MGGRWRVVSEERSWGLESDLTLSGPSLEACQSKRDKTWRMAAWWKNECSCGRYVSTKFAIMLAALEVFTSVESQLVILCTWYQETTLRSGLVEL